MTYNTTAIENATNYGELFIAFNDLTNGLLVLLLMLAVYFVIFHRIDRMSDLKKFVGATFLTNLTMFLAWLAELVKFEYLIVSLVLLLAAILFKYFAE